MQQEIKRPRCTDIMTLSSDFDKLLYFCQECDYSGRFEKHRVNLTLLNTLVVVSTERENE